MDRPFKSPAVTAGRKLLARFGVSALYTPTTGDPVSLRVWFRQDARLQVGGYDSTSTVRVHTVEVIREDLEGLDFTGKFTIDSTDYDIVETIGDDTERIMFQVK